MKYAKAYPSSSIFVWLFLVVILVGLVLAHRSAGADTLHAWVETYRGNHSADRPLQADVRQLYQPSNVLFGVVQPGRRGVADQDGRPGAEPDQAAREPMPPGGRLRPIIIEALLNRQVSVPLMGGYRRDVYGAHPANRTGFRDHRARSFAQALLPDGWRSNPIACRHLEVDSRGDGRGTECGSRHRRRRAFAPGAAGDDLHAPLQSHRRSGTGPGQV
jgi:hypothetical protein